jgi:trigger factor
MSKNVKELTIKVEGKEWKDAIDAAFEKANKKVKIDGFRPGKAPKEVFLKKYGVEALYMDAADSALEAAYRKMFEDNKDLELVAQPEVNILAIDENHVEFKFVLTTKPEVKLGKYKGLGVKKETVKVTKKEVDERIEQIRHRYAENVTKEEGNVENGDIAVIDFEGFKDGVAFPGGKGENYSLAIGSGSFIPGFEEQLIGMKKGEEKEIEVTFPKDYHAEELKGAKATFKVKVNEIKEVVYPEINEDLFADMGATDIKTEEEFRKQLEETIKVAKEQEAENKYIDDLLAAAAKETKIDVPEAMIHEEAHRMVHQYEENLRMQGLTLEQFYQYTNSNEEALIDQMHDEAKNRVVYRLILEAIVKAEKIKVTDKQAEKEAEEIATKYQMKKEDFLKTMGGLEMIKYDLEMKAAMDVLKSE